MLKYAKTITLFNQRYNASFYCYDHKKRKYQLRILETNVYNILKGVLNNFLCETNKKKKDRKKKEDNCDRIMTQ